MIPVFIGLLIGVVWLLSVLVIVWDLKSCAPEKVMMANSGTKATDYQSTHLKKYRSQLKKHRRRRKKRRKLLEAVA